jgi:hypothetical protein
LSEQLLGYADFVKLVIEALEVVGVDYLIGGAVAAWAWGEPRSTLDLDLVVNIPVESVSLLSQELAKRDMLVPAGIIMDAIIEDRSDLPINAIHMYSGFKADLYPLRPNDELRLSALERRIQIDFGPPIGMVYVHSPEDLVVYKVLYFSISQQTKHLRDIAAILKSVGDEINYTYIETWVERKGLGQIWRQIIWEIKRNP